MKAIFAVRNTIGTVAKIRPEKSSGLYGVDTHFTREIVQRNTGERHFTFKKILSLTGLLHVCRQRKSFSLYQNGIIG